MKLPPSHAAATLPYACLTTAVTSWNASQIARLSLSPEDTYVFSSSSMVVRYLPYGRTLRSAPISCNSGIKLPPSVTPTFDSRAEFNSIRLTGHQRPNTTLFTVVAKMIFSAELAHVCVSSTVTNVLTTTSQIHPSRAVPSESVSEQGSPRNPCSRSPRAAHARGSNA